MESKKILWPYFLGIYIGFKMVTLFIIGTHVFSYNQQGWGNLLIGSAYLLWPIYILTFLIIMYYYSKTDTFSHLIKPLKHSLFFPPIGALFGVTLINLFFSIFKV
ncbi:hypothetical protein [Liberiplasma polymorphum]|uniref:hypothetical protein n=1 Tax=Liberiplasma polymorphum TaxID=3374570 RepID=UPI003776548D